eukprot:gene12162-8366_t
MVRRHTRGGKKGERKRSEDLIRSSNFCSIFQNLQLQEWLEISNNTSNAIEEILKRNVEASESTKDCTSQKVYQQIFHLSNSYGFPGQLFAPQKKKKDDQTATALQLFVPTKCTSISSRGIPSTSDLIFHHKQHNCTTHKHLSTTSDTHHPFTLPATTVVAVPHYRWK